MYRTGSIECPLEGGDLIARQDITSSRGSKFDSAATIAANYSAHLAAVAQLLPSSLARIVVSYSTDAACKAIFGERIMAQEITACNGYDDDECPYHIRGGPRGIVFQFALAEDDEDAVGYSNHFTFVVTPAAPGRIALMLDATHENDWPTHWTSEDETSLNNLWDFMAGHDPGLGEPECGVILGICHDIISKVPVNGAELVDWLRDELLHLWWRDT